MMATEVSSEDTGSVSTGTGGTGGGGPEMAHFSFYPKQKGRISDTGPLGGQNIRHPSSTSPDTDPEMILYPVAGGDIPGSVFSSGSGSESSTGAGSGAFHNLPSEGQGSRMSPTSATPEGPAGFGPLPPPPPGFGATGTADENDMLDGPEYEEEEVAFPLTAPPTNQ